MAENSERPDMEEARRAAAATFDIIPAGALIINDAHDWRQALPLRDHVLVCIDCGYRRPIKAQDARTCRQKAQSIRSGFGGEVVLQASGIRIGAIARGGGWNLMQFLPA